MDKTALLKKIRALAEHGVGGEAENAEEWAQTSALAKIAVISESND